MLREDLLDPELRRRGVAWGDALAAALGRRLAVRGEARPDLGRLMASQWQGAVLLHGFARDRPLADALRDDLMRWLAAVGTEV